MPSTHTPGPWVARQSEKQWDRGAYWFTGPKGPADPGALYSRTADLIPTTADARLIAAAPDLLEACSRAYEALAVYPISDIDPEEADIARFRCMKAIARATGEGDA